MGSLEVKVRLILGVLLKLGARRNRVCLLFDIYSKYILGIPSFNKSFSSE